VNELWEWREDYAHAGLSERTEQVQLALPILGMGGHELLAATVAITPYEPERWYDQIKESEGALTHFTYDETIHEEDDFLFETTEGEHWIRLPEACGILRGVSRLWAWQEPSFGPLTTTVDIPPQCECVCTDDHLCNVPDPFSLLVDLLGLQYYGHPSISKPGWGPGGDPADDMDMRPIAVRHLDARRGRQSELVVSARLKTLVSHRPMAAALRFFYSLLGPEYTGCVIRELVCNPPLESWEPGVRPRADINLTPRAGRFVLSQARFMLLAHLRLNDECVSAAIRGESFDRGRPSRHYEPRGRFEEFVADAHRDLGLFRPRHQYEPRAP